MVYTIHFGRVFMKNHWIKRSIILFLLFISIVSIMNAKNAFATTGGLLISWGIGLAAYFIYKYISKVIAQTNETTKMLDTSSYTHGVKQEYVANNGGHVLQAQQLSLDEESYLLNLEEEMFGNMFDPPISLTLKKKHKGTKIKKIKPVNPVVGKNEENPEKGDEPYDLV